MFQTISFTEQVMNAGLMASASPTTLTYLIESIEPRLDTLESAIESSNCAVFAHEVREIIKISEWSVQIGDGEQGVYSQLKGWVKKLSELTANFASKKDPVGEVLDRFRALREDFSKLEMEVAIEIVDELILVGDPASELGAVTSGHTKPHSSLPAVDLTIYSGRVTADYLIKDVILKQMDDVASGGQLVIDIRETRQVSLDLATWVWSRLKTSSINCLRNKILLLRFLNTSEEGGFQVRFEVTFETRGGVGVDFVKVSLEKIPRT
jgi:hypothetical protein